MRIILACNRSAGHIFPAKCLALSLRKNKVFLFVPSYHFKPLLKKEGHRVFGFPFRFRNIILEIFFRFWEGLYIICRLRPHRVVGFGGRESFFIILWAKIFLIDVVLYEPNAVIGKANRALSLLARSVYCGFYIKGGFGNNVRVGIPVRDGLKRWKKERAREKIGLGVSSPVILCFGGSQGSEFINNEFSKFVAESKEDFQVVHITGFKQKHYFSEFYDRINKNAVVYDFYREIGLLYSAADVVISRSGALTVTEVSYYRIAALFVPYPGAGGHQYANASYLERKGACFVVSQKNFSFEVFSRYIERLLKDSSIRKRMADNLGESKIAVSCKEFCHNFL